MGLLGWMAGCASSNAPQPGTSSSSIAVLQRGELVVCDPDQGSVSFVDPTSLELLARVEVGAQPTQLLVRTYQGQEEVLVTTQRGGELVAVDPATRSVRQRLAVCAGPMGMALGADGWLGVACAWQGEVRQVSADLRRSSRLFGLHRPQALAVQGVGSDRQVASSGLVGKDAALQVWQSGRPLRRHSFVAPVRTNAKGAKAPLTPNLVRDLLAGPDGDFVAVLQFVANTTEAHPGQPAGYGGFPDAAHGVLPAVARWHPARGWQHAVGFGAEASGVQRFAAPVALAPLGGRDAVAVVHQGGAQVSRLALRALAAPGSPAAAAVEPDASYPTGTGPAGVAVDANGLWYVDNQLDNSITRLDPTTGARTTRVRALPQPLSAAARAGRRQFVDARNVHLSPNGVLSCDTCHPGGGDDGLVWFLHAPGVSPRLRRTQHLGVSPLTQAEPLQPLPAGLHWDGEFDSLYPLLHSTVPNLLGGDALLLDASAIAAFVREAVAPPVPATPTNANAVLAGEQVFAQLGCPTCHKGPALTDNQFHAPLEPMTTTPGDTLLAARTPSLRGLFLRQGLFHDGRAGTLDDFRTLPGLGVHYLPPAALPAADFAALKAYLFSR